MLYGGFWRRFGAFWLDFLIWSPMILVNLYAMNWRLFSLYSFLPVFLLSFWYHVILVARYGGMPGKLLLKLRIVRRDGSPVDFQSAFLRHAVSLIFFNRNGRRHDCGARENER